MSQPKNIRDFLRWAASGRATYTQDRALTELGNQGLWEMKVIGEESCKPYVAHGNFNVDRQAVCRSQLTESGRKLLAQLEADDSATPNFENALAAAREAYPEQHIGQLISNALMTHGHDGNVFYTPDAELIGCLYAYASGGR